MVMDPVVLVGVVQAAAATATAALAAASAARACAAAALEERAETVALDPLEEGSGAAAERASRMEVVVRDQERVAPAVGAVAMARRAVSMVGAVDSAGMAQTADREVVQAAATAAAARAARAAAAAATARATAAARACQKVDNTQRYRQGKTYKTEGRKVLLI